MEICRFSSSFDIGVASVIGPQHEKNNLPNQDAYACFKSDQLVAFAVADGLGSAKFSEQGSGYATHLAVIRLINYLYWRENDARNISDVQHLKKIIVSDWKNKFNNSMSDYDTTLLFVGLTPKFCVIGQIGDGLILYQNSKSSDQYVKFSPTQKDYLNTPGATLAQPDALEKFQVEEYLVTPGNSYNAFLLTTDGVADDLSDAEKYFNDLKRELLQYSPKQWTARLREHLTNWQTPGHYDDKTLIIAISENQSEVNDIQNSEQLAKIQVTDEVASVVIDDSITPTIITKGEEKLNG